MGNSKRATTTSEGQRNRKRRRRNVRTAEILSSSSESSDSESSSSESEEEVAKHPTKTRRNQSVAADGEVEMRDAPSAVESKDSSDEESESDEDEEDPLASTERIFTSKSDRIPSPVRELHDPQAAARFEEYYMRLVTTEFGDDLNSVRMSKDFGDKSLPMLVRALKQGVNIFDADEKRIVVGGVSE